MSNCLKVLVFSSCFLVLLGGISVNVLAQEAQEAQAETTTTGMAKEVANVTEATAATEVLEKIVDEAVNLDENVQPADLGVGEPNLLPNNSFYFLKNWGRGISSFFTFNPVAKAELKLKFANEKLMEAKKLAEKTDNPQILKKAIDNFQKEENKLKEAVQKIKQGAENPRVAQFVDKFIEQGIKQQKLLGKFENDLPAEIHQDLMSAKEEVLSKFSDINLKFASPEIFAEKINKIIAKQEGSDFRQFKNLEVLNALKERVPKTARPAIERAIDNSLKNLKDSMEKMEPQTREKFKNYLFSVGGDESRHLLVLDQLESQDITTELRKDIETAKEKVLEKIERRLENYEKKNLGVAQRKLLEHLNTGEMSNLRIVKELENNFSPELAPKILEIKKGAKEKLIKALEVAEESPEEQKKIFDEIENKFYDIKQLEVFKEIEGIIPPEKQEFFEAMKGRVIGKIEREVKEAKNEADKRQVLGQVAGGTTEGIEVLQESGISPMLVQEITKETIAKISRRIENVQDPEKLENLKQDISEDKEIKEIIERNFPALFDKLEVKKENSLKDINKIKVEEQIRKAKEAIVLCEKEIQELGEGAKKEIIGSGLLENAKKHLETSISVFNENKIGEAFGRATAVLNKAGNCRKLINKLASQGAFKQERTEEFKKVMDEIKKEMPSVEIPDEIISEDMAVRCPMLVPPTSNSCNGKWVVQKTSAGCPLFKCLNASGNTGEIICAKQEEKVNRNPLIGPVNQKCCPGFYEVRISKSYSVCRPKIQSGAGRETPSIDISQPGQSNQPNVEIANPASVYCQKMGYKLEIRTNFNGGQYGVCIFPDGKECEEWAFFRSECGNQYKKEDASTGQLSPSDTFSDTFNTSDTSSAGQVCVQIITPAISPEGICKEFFTPCSVPSDWRKVDKCPLNSIGTNDSNEVTGGTINGRQ
jgi:putative hemolysin